MRQLLTLLLLAGSLQAQMLVPIVAGAAPAASGGTASVASSGANANYSTGVSVAMTIVSTSNKLYLILYADGGSPTTPLATPAGCGTWTTVGSEAALNSGRQQWYSATPAATGACSISIARSNSGTLYGAAWEVSNSTGNVRNSNIYHQGYTASGTVTGPSVTATTGDLVLGLSGGSTAAMTLSLPTFTQDRIGPYNSYLEITGHLTNVTGGSIHMDFSGNTGGSWNEAVIAVY